MFLSKNVQGHWPQRVTRMSMRNCVINVTTGKGTVDCYSLASVEWKWYARYRGVEKHCLIFLFRLKKYNNFEHVNVADDLGSIICKHFTHFNNNYRPVVSPNIEFSTALNELFYRLSLSAAHHATRLRVCSPLLGCNRSWKRELVATGGRWVPLARYRKV